MIRGPKSGLSAAVGVGTEAFCAAAGGDVQSDSFIHSLVQSHSFIRRSTLSPLTVLCACSTYGQTLVVSVV